MNFLTMALCIYQKAATRSDSEEGEGERSGDRVMVVRGVESLVPLSPTRLTIQTHIYYVTSYPHTLPPLTFPPSPHPLTIGRLFWQTGDGHWLCSRPQVY